MTSFDKRSSMYRAKWENCTNEFDILAEKLKENDLEINVTKKAEKFKKLYAKMVSKNDK